MKILYFNRQATRSFFAQSFTGNSPAIDTPNNVPVITALLSSVTGGSALLQYSLSNQEDVQGDTAIWHDWSVGSVSDEGGIAFDSPIRYIRVIANEGVSYTIEALS